MTAKLRVVGLPITIAGTGIPRAFGLLQVTVGALATLTTDVSGFLPGIADPLNLLLTATVYLAPLAAATGAAHAASFQSRGIGSIAAVTPRGRHAAALLNWGAVAGWSLVTYLTMLAVLVLRADLSGSTTPAMFMLVVLAVTLLLAAAAVGTVAATLTPSPLVAPALAVALFTALYVISYATGPWAVLSPTSPATFYRPFFEPRVGLIAAQAACVVGGAVLLWAAVHHGLRRLLVASTGALVLVLGGLELWEQAAPHTDLLAVGAGLDAPLQVRTPPARPACGSSDGVLLCVWPESAPHLQPSLQALAQVKAAASPYLDVPDRYAEPAVGVPGQTFVLPIRGDGALFTAVIAAIPEECTDQAALDAMFDLRAWLAVRVGERLETRRIKKVAALPSAHQQAWVNRRLDQATACSTS